MAANPPFILYHYESSPFSEKVRLAFGVKQATWRSVEVATVPPRPMIDTLTGGYRRIPVLQVGADIFCDTNLILPTLERLIPAPPSLYSVQSRSEHGTGISGALLVANRALSRLVGFNWERSVWLAAIGVRVLAADDDPPADFLEDRKQDYLYIDMSKSAMEPKEQLNCQRMQAQLAFVADMLSDGRNFLFGDKPDAADLAVAHVVWLMRSANAEKVDSRLGLESLLPWFKRVLAIGHGNPVSMQINEALAIARSSEPMGLDYLGEHDGAFQLSSSVCVTPDDFARIPVAGRLVGIDRHEVVIERSVPDVGALRLHFPRAGFTVEANREP